MRGGTILAALLLVGGLATSPARGADLDQIQALADRGRTEEALRRVEGYLVGQTEQLDGQLLRGVLLADLGRGRDAERAFLLLTRQYPDRPEPIHNLAVMRARAGRPAMATQALESLVARFPTYETALSNLERIRLQAASGEYDPLESDNRRMRLALTPRLRFPVETAAAVVVAEAAPAPPAARPTSPPPPAARPASPPPSTERPSERSAEPDRPTANEPEMAARDLPLADLVPIGRRPAPPPAASPTEVPIAETTEAPDVQPAAKATEVPEPQATEALEIPTTEIVETSPTQAAEVVDPAPPAVPTMDPEPASAAASPPAVLDLRAELEAVVTAWAAAWSEQRVKEYLAFYATGFQPVGYPSRDAWETVRRQRVAAPTFIEVEIDLDSMNIQRTGPGEVSVTFVQSYRSDRYGDTVRKTLGFTREDGEWRILSEASQ